MFSLSDRSKRLGKWIVAFALLSSIAWQGGVRIAYMTEKTAAQITDPTAVFIETAFSGDATQPYKVSVDSLLNKADVTTVANVAALFARTDAMDNQLFQTLGYETEGIGANPYRYDASSTATIDGGFVLPGPGGTLSFSGTTFNGDEGDGGRFIAVEQSECNTDQFGSVPGSDIYGPLSRAIASASTVGSALSVVTISKGIYTLSAPVLVPVSGAHLRIRGMHPRSTTIVASASMASMLSIGDASGVFSRITIENILFNQNNLAAIGIDATYVRYSTIHHCEVSGTPSSGIAIKCGRWVNRITNNELNGDWSGSQQGCGIEIPNDAINNLVINTNSITSFNTGIRCLAGANMLEISSNTFEACDKSAIYLAEGCRQVVIERNYFETCGTASDASGVAVDVVGGGTANYAAPIVSEWSQGGSLFLQGLIVNRNQFSDCSPRSLAVFSGVSGLSWRDNHVGVTSTYDSCIRFVEFGASESGAGGAKPHGIIIDQSDYGPTFTELVDFTSDYERTDRSGLQITWRRGTAGHGGSIGVNELPISDLTSADWTVNAGSVTDVGLYEGTSTVYEFSTAGDIERTFTFDSAMKSMRGQYWRIGYLTKGASTNQVEYMLSIDTGSGFVQIHDDSQPGGDDWHAEGINMAFLIPDNAVAMKLRLRRLHTGSTPQITALRVVRASLPEGS